MIATSHLFHPLHGELIALLAALEPADWGRPTVAGAWRVKDVAAHLLDGMWRRLAAARDGHLVPPAEPLDSPGAFVAFIDRLNADWVKAMDRLSPRQLVDLLEPAGRELADFFVTLDPAAPAFWPVSWAGENESRNWMDVGRDYTEQWHHQQQIRLATGHPLQLDRQFGRPALHLFAKALPIAYRETAAPEGTAIAIEIRGEAGGSFVLRRGERGWSLEEGEAADPTTRLAIRDADAWRLFTKSLRGEAARRAVEAAGEARFAAPFLAALAVIG